MMHRMVRDDGSTEEVEVPDELIAEWQAAVKHLHRVMCKIRRRVPNAQLYLADEGPNLMVGPTHIGGARAKACQENAVATGKSWPWASGGDW